MFFFESETLYSIFFTSIFLNLLPVDYSFLYSIELAKFLINFLENEVLN